MSDQVVTRILLSLNAPPRILTIPCTERALRNTGKKFVAGGRRVLNIPGFTGRLETLYIASNGGCDFNDHDLDTFHRHLIKCSNVRDLTLIVGGSCKTDIGMAPFIPKSIEHLAFHCSTSEEMLEDLDTWVACATDLTWAPSLKTFTINTDASKRHISAFDVKLQDDIDPSKVSKFEHKLNAICKALKSRDPPVEIFF
ncbi:hypothetical protein NLJ89_g8522 [Agrocybe chaxingu]|uniref:Uncharacterized protein n=1 Tax=Agrocybe chaxingu TaxID=84603 RepID=A0A9W8JUH7_9AGAR|nr:hypothetical protein NLJ89_g8522 [Agrocybe chaxingu]